MIQINIKVTGLNESLLVSGRTMSRQKGLVLVLKEHCGLLLSADLCGPSSQLSSSLR